MSSISPALSGLAFGSLQSLTGSKKTKDVSAEQALKLQQMVQASSQPTVNTVAKTTNITASQEAINASAKTLFDTQAIAQQTDQLAEADKSDGVVDQFMKFMDSAHKGMADFIRAQMLASKGLTEESFAQLSPEDQQKINEEIRKQIEESVQKQAEKEASKTSLAAL